MNTTTQPATRAEISAGRLQRALMERYPDNFMMYADVFAMGCLLHLQGHQRAGMKLIDQVRSALPATGNKTYYAELLDSLPGNETRFACEIQAHSEINALFEIERDKTATRAG